MSVAEVDSVLEAPVTYDEFCVLLVATVSVAGTLYEAMTPRLSDVAVVSATDPVVNAPSVSVVDELVVSDTDANIIAVAELADATACESDTETAVTYEPL